MRNRQVIKYLIYPKYFSSIAIPYKGRYLIRIRLYQKKLLNQKITYAYPYINSLSIKSLVKPFTPVSTYISVNDTYYQSQTFSLFYSDEKLLLNHCCTFVMEYDNSRQFKTFVQFQLIRRNQINKGDHCLNNKNTNNINHEYKQSQKNSNQQHNQDQQNYQDQFICKQIYEINQYKQLDCFQRVYFHHHEFYCALDLYICSISLGLSYRNHKYQLVQFSINPKLHKKSQPKHSPSISLNQLVFINNKQIQQYQHIRKLYQKYALTIKLKKSFIFSEFNHNILQFFQDFQHIKYFVKDYQGMDQHQVYLELRQDKIFINHNIQKVFDKLILVIKDMAFAIFNAKLNQTLKRKFQLKNKYLVKKVQTLYRNSQTYPHQNEIQTSLQVIQIQHNKSSFKQNRKSEKKQFIHIRRQQFKSHLPIINLKQQTFPMILIQKSHCNQKAAINADSYQSGIGLMSQEIHLIVLVHGFHGSHYDLKKLRNFLEHLNQKFRILAVNSIEKHSGENFQFLGNKIAKEIEFYIQNSYEKFKIINFIGFSMGGVLVRACLKNLTKYKQLMGLLITLASPHLGISQSQNTLVNLGIWYLSKIDKAQNIQQLNFSSITQKGSYMMKLSQSDEMSWFKKVIIISSKQDQFVPHYSARIQESSKNVTIRKMARNIMGKIQQWDRIQVWFDVEQVNTFDKVVGRKAHIQFIQNFSFLQMLCHIYQNQF